MSNKILITDSLFFKPHHVKELEDAGYVIERLDKPNASEEELCEAVKGKVGYLLGGIEKITDKVIESADELRAIVVTATGYIGFVPGYKLATVKGIAVANAPHKNVHSVAEFGMTMSLLMTRDAVALSRVCEKTFETTRSLSGLRVGVVGLGHVGSEYARLAKCMGVTNLSYFSRTRKPEVEQELGIGFKELKQLFQDSDLVYVALPMEGVGKNFFQAAEINALRPGSIIISTSDPEQFDQDALYTRLESGEIRVAFDDNIKTERFQNLPISAYYAPNESVAFNTSDAVEKVSDSCVKSMINLLKTGEDQYRLN